MSVSCSVSPEKPCLWSVFIVILILKDSVEKLNVRQAWEVCPYPIAVLNILPFNEVRNVRNVSAADRRLTPQSNGDHFFSARRFSCVLHVIGRLKIKRSLPQQQFALSGWSEDVRCSQTKRHEKKPR